MLFACAAAVASSQCVSNADPIAPQYSDAYSRAQQRNNRPSMSTELIVFSLAGVPYHAPPKNTNCCKPLSLPEHEDEIHQFRYRVPRSYLVWMDKWNGGPQTLVKLKVTFPGFEPLTEKNKRCMSVAPTYRPSGCTPVEFIIRGGDAYDPPDDVRFNNSRKLFRSQQPLRGPYGFELYETGPLNGRINTYRKKTSDHTLVISCMRAASDHQPSICGVTSRLASGNVLEYRLYGDQLKDAERIDEGVRRLIARFQLEAKEN